LIGVTAPAVNQLTVAGGASTFETGATVLLVETPIKHPIYSENSYVFKSANLFNPTYDV